MAQTADYEKLGVFYLGSDWDPATGKRTGAPLLYPSRDLTTHAVIIGMTGSGKTGLGLGLLEEAAIDKVPVIAIDPKGDLGNLLLTFPDLDAASFAPWINADEAAAKGQDPAAYAASEAARWTEGLASWGQQADRVRRLRETVDLAVWTPGHAAGRPISVVSSFAAPPPEVRADRAALAERIAASSSSLLGLLGIDADPLRSREHLLLSALLHDAWSAGRDLDLAALVGAVQSPPIARVGVMDLETFYPAKERFELALAINALVASPGFAAWAEGPPLDASRLLYADDGRPRVSVVSIAHLGDAERMFFVTLLLNELLSWMRAQPGTSSLRAVLYMDEIFGYFPPTANPPSKTPMLTLLKQARAFGLGLVLSTQNPVDLDYKGLANAGTWFVGRLQTERDKARVIEALEGALTGPAAVPRERIDALLSALGKRVFLLHSVHAPGPVLFETRWTLSYLRGPLTLLQLERLAEAEADAPAPRAASATSSAATATASASPPVLAAVPAPAHGAAARPVLPPDVPQVFLPADGSGAVTYRPAVLAVANVRYANAKLGVDVIRPATLLAPLSEGPIPLDWDAARALSLDPSALLRDPQPGAAFIPPPSAAANAKSYPRWSKDAVRRICTAVPLTLLRAPALGLTARDGEDERAFRIRVREAAREERDAAVDALRAKYAARLATAREKVRRAEANIAVQEEQARQSQLETAVTVGAGLLGAIFGRSARVGTAVTRAGRAYREQQDVGRAAQTAQAARDQLAELEARIEAEAAELAAAGAEPSVEAVEIKPKAADVDLRLLALAWEP